MEMPSFDAISNLAAAQKSLAASKQAYENWAERYEQNENELMQALARQAALKEEKELRERDIAEGTKHLHTVWMALGKPPAAQPAQPVSPPASPGPKRLTKEQKAAMSPQEKKARAAAKKAAKEERKAHRTPEEQAKIDARVANMQKALKASREAKKGILSPAVGDDLPSLVAEGTA